MNYELRQQVIEPGRATFQHLVDRYGDRPASRYQEASVDVQPRENFHYRPLWDPEHEIYDPDFSTLRLDDPYSFTDPRQYYYATYTAARAAQQDAFSRTLDYLDAKNLWSTMPSSWSAVIASVLVPLRHYESGAELVFAAGSRFAYGTTIEQCCSYAAFDRIANAQMLSRIGLGLDGGLTNVLTTAKAAWLDAPYLQGLRRSVEEILVEADWAVAVTALDMIDSLLYPLLYNSLDEIALLSGGGAYSLIAQHFAGWWSDHRRWLDALYGAWTSDATYGGANRAALSTAASRCLATAERNVAELVPTLAGVADQADLAAALSRSRTAVGERLGGLGLELTGVLS